MTAREVVAGGVRLQVAEAGRGPALVLLHGLAASHAIWAEVAPALGAGWRVIAPDLAGHGESAKPDAPYTVAWHADLVRALLDALDVGDAVVAGNSLGGRIAVELAVRHPARVRAAVLSAPAGDFPPWLGLAWRAVARLASPPLVGAVLRRGVVRSFFDPASPGCAARRRIVERRLEADDFPAHARAVVRSIAGALAAEHGLPGRVRQPVLVTWGRQDRVVPFAGSAALLRQVPQARFEAFERCGHIPMLERPAAFVAVVRGFLDTLDAAPGLRAAGDA